MSSPIPTPSVYTGVTQVITSTSVPSTATAIPLNVFGGFPRTVRLIATNPVIVKFGTTGTDSTPTLNDMLVTSNPDYQNVQGRRTFTAVLHTTNPATSVLSICPVE